ncbi:hypothetical protein [Xenorhabdus sp. PB30.3]|uniref:hypothetical protein n=1 Tax=Xenorhabdus sp. PB30.3 TaxID=2788941 RepID=UPI001E307CB2|nr:hypothetical protein [Xenorhabdus sp. PB30.3]MCC8380217.1 hypothetical protein [Xenorhabdus sp. PB30.3]
MNYLIGMIFVLFNVIFCLKQDKLNLQALEKNENWGIYTSIPDGKFEPLKIKKYKEIYILAFSYIIKILGKQDVNNNFCLIGYHFDKKMGHDEFNDVVIYWKTANRLISWELPDGSYNEKIKSILYSHPFMDIDEYVVSYEEPVDHQILQAKEGVIQMMEDCEFHGQKITITPFEVLDIQ